MPKTTNNKRVGDIGEKIACGYLGGKGYRVLERNFRTRFGELDIIAISPLKTLVFVEVKTLTNFDKNNNLIPESYPHTSGNSGTYKLSPEDHLSLGKMARFRKIAEWYANNNENVSRNGYQLDVICITISPEGETLSLNHLSNV